MSSSKLKIIACLAMLIDHMGMVLVNPSPLYYAMRIIGRIAFPIFAFFIAEGFFRTKNVYKYMGRLLLFALISEVPYDMAQGAFMQWSNLNIFFTLAMGLLCMHLYHKVRGRGYGLFIVLAGGIVAELVGADYGMYGILTVFIFHYYRNNFHKQLLVFGGMTALYVMLTVMGNSIFHISMVIQLFAITSLLLIKTYNGRKGMNMKYLFYVFYPGHLLILGIIRMFYM